ncbi:MAG: M43 family zinc metalloprotease [Salibacteraceae bacterium]
MKSIKMLSYINRCWVFLIPALLILAAFRPAPQVSAIDGYSTQGAASAYAPLIPEHTPIKFVRTVFHIMQRDDGSGNFPDDSASRQWLTYLYHNHSSDAMGDLRPMNLPTASPYIRDSRIRFQLEGIYFHQDDYGWNMAHDSHQMGEKLYKKYVLDDPGTVYPQSAIHIFIGGQGSSHGRASGIASGKWILVSSVYKKYLQGNHWIPAGLLRHELGHSLGLIHTWNAPDRCDDTPLNAGCWNVNEPAKPECATPSNNVMDYNACQCALTACQMGRMHQALMGKFGKVDNVLVTDFCRRVDPLLTINSGDSVVWVADRYLKSDLRIEPGATLVVQGAIGMPRSSRIVVRPGGRLIVENGRLFQPCGGQWKGIKLVKGKRQGKRVMGSLEITGKGKVEHTR